MEKHVHSHPRFAVCLGLGMQRPGLQEGDAHSAPVHQAWPSHGMMCFISSKYSIPQTWERLHVPHFTHREGGCPAKSWSQGFTPTVVSYPTAR